jgi:hypothetical protein
VRPFARKGREGRRGWLGKLGAAAFLFFLIKGLLWLLLPLAIMFWGFLGF